MRSFMADASIAINHPRIILTVSASLPARFSLQADFHSHCPLGRLLCDLSGPSRCDITGPGHHLVTSRQHLKAKAISLYPTHHGERWRKHRDGTNSAFRGDETRKMSANQMTATQVVPIGTSNSTRMNGWVAHWVTLLDLVVRKSARAADIGRHLVQKLSDWSECSPRGLLGNS